VNIILFIGGCSLTPAKQVLKPCCCTMVIRNHQSPFSYSILRKETYQTTKILIDLLEYPKCNWKICSDLKVVSLLHELQLRNTKHMCFLCLWNSRQDSSQYAAKIWHPRQSPQQMGRHNDQHQPLVSSANVFLRLLHIKLGLMKNFVKTMYRDGDGFKFLKICLELIKVIQN